MPLIPLGNCRWKIIFYNSTSPVPNKTIKSALRETNIIVALYLAVFNIESKHRVHQWCVSPCHWSEACEGWQQSRFLHFFVMGSPGNSRCSCLQLQRVPSEIASLPGLIFQLFIALTCVAEDATKENMHFRFVSRLLFKEIMLTIISLAPRGQHPTMTRAGKPCAVRHQFDGSEL